MSRRPADESGIDRSKRPGSDIGRGDEAHRRRTLSQNFFRSNKDAEAFAAQLPDPVEADLIVEIGSGSGRITKALSRRTQPVLAIEIDEQWFRRLSDRNLPGVELVWADFLDLEPPDRPVAAIGNLPFGTGTAILRHCLEFGPRLLYDAVFLMQAEYVAKRIGSYGGNLFNAQWWPWYEFDEGLKFNRNAFEPYPNADTSTLLVQARRSWDLDWNERGPYQEFVSAVFNTGNASIGQALRSLLRSGHRELLKRADIPEQSLVKQLDADDWLAMYRSRPVSRPGPRPSDRRR